MCSVVAAVIKRCTGGAWSRKRRHSVDGGRAASSVVGNAPLKTNCGEMRLKMVPFIHTDGRVEQLVLDLHWVRCDIGTWFPAEVDDIIISYAHIPTLVSVHKTVNADASVSTNAAYFTEGFFSSRYLSKTPEGLNNYCDSWLSQPDDSHRHVLEEIVGRMLSNVPNPTLASSMYNSFVTLEACRRQRYCHWMPGVRAQRDHTDDQFSLPRLIGVIKAVSKSISDRYHLTGDSEGLTLSSLVKMLYMHYATPLTRQETAITLDFLSLVCCISARCAQFDYLQQACTLHRSATVATPCETTLYAPRHQFHEDSPKDIYDRLVAISDHRDHTRTDEGLSSVSVHSCWDPLSRDMIAATRRAFVSFDEICTRISVTTTRPFLSFIATTMYNLSLVDEFKSPRRIICDWLVAQLVPHYRRGIQPPHYQQRILPPSMHANCVVRLVPVDGKCRVELSVVSEQKQTMILSQYGHVSSKLCGYKWLFLLPHHDLFVAQFDTNCILSPL